MTLVSGNIISMRIFAEVPCRWASHYSGLIEIVDFQCFRTLYISGLLGNKANIYSIIKSIVAFPLIPKYTTLNDLEWPFYVKFCFRAGTSRFFLRGFRKQWRKTNEKYTHTVSDRNACQGLYFWYIQVYTRKETYTVNSHTVF